MWRIIAGSAVLSCLAAVVPAGVPLQTGAPRRRRVVLLVHMKWSIPQATGVPEKTGEILVLEAEIRQVSGASDGRRGLSSHALLSRF